MKGLAQGRIVLFVGNEGKYNYPAVITKVLDADTGECVLTVFGGVPDNAAPGWRGYDESTTQLRFLLQNAPPGAVVVGTVGVTIAKHSHQLEPGTWHWPTLV